MLTPTTEIVIFDTSDSSFHPTSELLMPTFKQLKAGGVNVPFYTGVEAIHPKLSFIVVQWDNYEQHKKITETPFHTELAKSLAPILAGPSPPGPLKHQIYHVQFSGPTVAFDYPVTQVALITLKDPANRGAVVDILSKSSEVSENVCVFGQTREDENKYIVVYGWPTVEAHEETTARPDVAATVQQLRTLSTSDNLYFAKLTKCL